MYICSLSLPSSDTPARKQSCQHCTQDRWRQFEISWRDLFTICYICFMPPRDCGVTSNLVWLIKVGPRHSYNQNTQHRKARVTQLVVHRHKGSTIWIGNMGIFTIFLMHLSGLSFARRGFAFYLFWHLCYYMETFSLHGFRRSCIYFTL